MRSEDHFDNYNEINYIGNRYFSFPCAPGPCVYTCICVVCFVCVRETDKEGFANTCIGEQKSSNLLRNTTGSLLFALLRRGPSWSASLLFINEYDHVSHFRNLTNYEGLSQGKAMIKKS